VNELIERSLATKARLNTIIKYYDKAEDLSGVINKDSTVSFAEWRSSSGNVFYGGEKGEEGAKKTNSGSLVSYVVAGLGAGSEGECVRRISRRANA